MAKPKTKTKRASSKTPASKTPASKTPASKKGSTNAASTKLASTKRASTKSTSKKAASKKKTPAEQLIECDVHGTTRAAFVCTHLNRGVACGFHANPPAPDDPCPDAWCDLCESVFQAAGGEWNDDNTEIADIAALCTGCYADSRARNIDPPSRTRGKARTLTDDEIEELLHHATHEAQALQAASEKKWHWSKMARWDYDPDASTLTFSDPTKPTIVADIELVGSFSTTTDTFQWAWETLDDWSEMERVRAFGEVRGIKKLTTANWAAEEVDGWEMTSLAAYLLGAGAVYRAPFDHVRWFMLLRNWRPVAKTKRSRG
jgi:hypothetical protein